MKTTRKNWLAVLAGVLLAPALIAAQDDPHWRKDTCRTCHAVARPVAGNLELNTTDTEALCESCHGDGGSAVGCRHGSGLEPGNVEIPATLRAAMKNGRVVCSTCHDVSYQCEHPSTPYSFMNPGFLRESKSPEPGRYCFECHDSSGLAKLDPHNEEAGDPPRPTCPLCHIGIPETGASGRPNVGYNMQHDLNDTCRGCHVVPPHPKNQFALRRSDAWDHLVVPSPEILGNMRAAQAETGIELPLNPLNGEVFCATCHDPHDLTVGGEHGSGHPAAENRLRMDDICQACHDK